MLYILPTDTCYGIGCAFHDKSSYERIYKLKKRSFDKPLAILVESFEWLAKNTELTTDQITFLKKYHRPFTILTQSIPVRAYLEFLSEDEEAFINKDIYKNISFRVAHHPSHKKLLKTTGPLWLTSANITAAGETYSPKKILEDFAYQIKNNEIEFIDVGELNRNTPASDVFRFIGESLELEYVRKN